MERETRTIQTPAQKSLTLKTYLTARERNEVRDVFLKSAKINLGKSNGPENDLSIDASIMTESQNLLVKIVVTEYDGKTNPDAILNTLLEARPEEYDFVVEEAGKVDGNLTTAK